MNTFTATKLAEFPQSDGRSRVFEMHTGSGDAEIVSYLSEPTDDRVQIGEKRQTDLNAREVANEADRLEQAKQQAKDQMKSDAMAALAQAKTTKEISDATASLVAAVRSS